MKAVFVISSLEGGGKERQCIALIQGLLQKGVSCKLILLRDLIAFEEIYELDCEVILADKTKLSKVQIVKKLMATLRKTKPDLIQAWDSQSALYAGFASFFTKTRFVNYSIQYAKQVKLFSKHGLTAAIGFWFSNIIVANSEAGLSTHWGIKNGIAIKNGYDFNRLKKMRAPEQLRQELDLNYEHTIGMVGNFLDAKDQKTLIKACLKLIEQGVNLGLVLVGNGKAINELLNLIPPVHAARIKFIQGKTQVEEYINLTDIHCLICNTRGHAEGISNAIMEGMALGKPVVATDSGGNKELVLHEQTGYIVSPFDVDELAGRLNQLIDNKTLRKSFGEAGLVRIQKEFSLDSLVNQFMKLYNT